MNTTAISSFNHRIKHRVQNAWMFIRKLRFKQIMGLVIILKTFNPLWFLLAMSLFSILLVNDLREQYRPAFELITSNYDAILNQDLRGLQTALNTARGAMQGISDILKVLSSIVNAIVGFVNTIIDILAWLLGLNNINLGIHIPIPDLGLVFKPFNDFAIHFKGLFEGISGLFTVTKVILIDLWERFKVFVFAGVAWALISILASVYSEVSRGLEMIRGNNTLARSHGGPGGLPEGQSNDLATPPVILVSQSQITIPILAIHPGTDRAISRERTFAFQDRYLLSAQGIWPDRHSPLFYQQLAERVDEATWAQFWQSLIRLGMDPAMVKMVISTDTRILAPSVKRYLPEADLQQSVETTFINE